MCSVSSQDNNGHLRHSNNLSSQKTSVSICVPYSFKLATFILLLLIVLCEIPSIACESSHSADEPEEPHIHVISWNWDHVGVFITITAFIVFSGLAKVGK